MPSRQGLDLLRGSYQSLQASLDESPPSRQVGDVMDAHGDERPEDVVIHTVNEMGRSRWSHINDLDSFFERVYNYHRRHGFKVMMVQEVFGIIQLAFIVFISTYTLECVKYDVLFGNERLSVKVGSHDHKVTMSDCVTPLPQCVSQFSFLTWVALLIASLFLFTRIVVTFYHFFYFWDIKSFYNVALKIKDTDLDSISWQEIQQRVVAAQKEHMMCIHKETLTELDIYHRILRLQNYMVAMINKDLLPVKIFFPFIGEKRFLSHGLIYNLEFIFFKGHWAPFNQWHLRDEFKKVSNKKQLADYLGKKIAFMALVNLLFMPFILFWQVLYCFFSYGEQMRREPGSLGVRKWSHYARLYLRHFNELDHELKARLNRAYKPANKYMDLFVSPMTVAIAQNVAFMGGSLLIILVGLSVWDEDVLQVEHVLTVITVLGALVAVCRVFIPDENMVFCPEKMLTAVLAQIHYFPDSWKGRAHTTKVMSEVEELFPYTAMYLLHEILSPIITPFILYFSLKPKAPAIVDFFRNFTVEVTGVGDVCSFAQMDIRRHGNPMWHNSVTMNDQPKTNHYTQAENGKTEMSLVHFALANPDWKPPNDAGNFISALKDHACREVEALPTLAEEVSTDNPLVNSLNSLEIAAGVQSRLSNNSALMKEIQVSVASSTVPPVSLSPQPRDSSLVGSVYQGLNARNSMLASNVNQPSSLLSSRMIVGTSGAAGIPNLRQDLHQLGLEYTEADMSFSALYLHELHHRMSLNTGSRRGNLPRYESSSRYEFQNQRRASLNELDEEGLPLIETPSTPRLASSTRS